MLSAPPFTAIRRASGVAFGLAFLAVATGGCDPEATTPLPPTTELDAGRFGSGPAAPDVAKPFKADGYTELAGLAPDPLCGAPPRFLNTQVGEGTGTHLGRFTMQFTFCVDATDLVDDNMLTEGESVPYDLGVGILTAANGDQLYLSISGAVLPSDHPDFDFEFHDAFEIIGGSGRFEGATGEGVTDAYVVQAIDRTTHHITGTLVLPKGGS